MESEEQQKQRRKELMLSAVQEQMTSPESPEVKIQYERLIALGHSDSEANELIATILTFFFWHKLRKDGYTYADYVAELSRLPDIDWGDAE